MTETKIIIDDLPTQLVAMCRESKHPDASKYLQYLEYCRIDIGFHRFAQKYGLCLESNAAENKCVTAGGVLISVVERSYYFEKAETLRDSKELFTGLFTKRFPCYWYIPKTYTNSAIVVIDMNHDDMKKYTGEVLKISDTRILRIPNTSSAYQFTPLCVDAAEGKSGRVYFIGNCGTGNIKIGMTSSPILGRLKALQTGNDQDLNIIGTVETDDYRELELYLHKEFSDKHVRGEWFSIRMQDVIDAVYGIKQPLEKGNYTKKEAGTTSPKQIETKALASDEKNQDELVLLDIHDNNTPDAAPIFVTKNSVAETKSREPEIDKWVKDNAPTNNESTSQYYKKYKDAVGESAKTIQVLTKMVEHAHQYKSASTGKKHVWRKITPNFKIETAIPI